MRADLAGDRNVNLTSFWDGSAWHLWIPKPDGTLLPMRPLGCGEASYLGREPADPNDIHSRFADFVWRRASWADVAHWQGAMIEDVHQLAASIAKINFFWRMREHAPALVLARFASSEIEYLLTVCRSAFDLLQESIRRVCAHLRVGDARQRGKKALPDSFREMVMSSGALMSAEQIATTRGVPMPLAEAYAAGGAFFSLLRGLRDGIVHGGREAPYAMTTDRGFIIRRDSAFAALPIWKDEHLFNEQAVSLRPALAYVVGTTLATCDTFAEALGRSFEFPPDLAPGYRLFIRSADGSALTALQQVRSGGSPWWTADGEAAPPTRGCG